MKCRCGNEIEQGGNFMCYSCELQAIDDNIKIYKEWIKNHAIKIELLMKEKIKMETKINERKKIK